jgi:hypothetical protein
MVGDLQRIKLYATPERPFQIPQEVRRNHDSQGEAVAALLLSCWCVQIPADVWEAYELLVAKGFTWNIIK